MIESSDFTDYPHASLDFRSNAPNNVSTSTVDINSVGRPSILILSEQYPVAIIFLSSISHTPIIAPTTHSEKANKTRSALRENGNTYSLLDLFIVLSIVNVHIYIYI